MADFPPVVNQEQRRVLEKIAGSGDGPHAQRARAIAEWLAEPDLGRAAAASRLRPTQVRHWLRAFTRSGLGIFPAPVLAVATASPPGPAAPAPTSRRPPAPRIRPTEPMPRALWRILAFHFGKLKKLERAVLDADEEAIHDTRVAIRRLRAALRIARPFFPGSRLRRLRSRLQETAQALGRVRDLDVILAHAREYAAQQPGVEGDLGAWIQDLQGRRADAHESLREHLAGKRFRRLRTDLQVFLKEAKPAAGIQEGVGTPAPGLRRVRDVVPAAIWTQYGAVRAYEAVAEPTPESLHALRIEIKRLRYLMEFFRTALGLRVEPDIALAIRAQDHLGRLHDAWVAVELLRGHLAASGGLDASAVAGAAAYLAQLEREIQSRMATFPALWQEMTVAPFRRKLARLLSRL